MKQRFERIGFAGPFTLCSVAHMAEVRERLALLIQERRAEESIYSAVKSNMGDGKALEAIYDAHHDDDTVLELATHPEIVTRARAILGDPLCVWRTTFWIKPPGGRRLEWHQDTYKSEGFGSFPNINAWIAVDDATDGNCVQLVEGSHKEIIDLSVFREPDYIRELQRHDGLPYPPASTDRKIVKMVLKPGQFFIFDGRILHGSPPNKTENRRAGLVVRFIPRDISLPNLTTPCIPV